MTLPAEHKALIFVGAVAVLGAGVRVVRVAASPLTSMGQPALEHQVQSADSSARVGKGPGRGGRRTRSASATPGDTGRARRGGRTGADSTSHLPPRLPLDRNGYINGRLDLDVATAPQVDSLPGVLPRMAKRIVADRLVRGPFLTIDGLRRVQGVGPRFIEQIDSLVTFSGTVVQPNPADTVIPRPKRKRPKTA